MGTHDEAEVLHCAQCPPNESTLGALQHLEELTWQIQAWKNPWPNLVTDSQGYTCCYTFDHKLFLQANNQLDGALEYLAKVGSDPIKPAELEEASGVGVEVTQDQLAAAVKEVIKAEADRLREDRCLRSDLPFSPHPHARRPPSQCKHGIACIVPRLVMHKGADQLPCRISWPARLA